MLFPLGRFRNEIILLSKYIQVYNIMQYSNKCKYENENENDRNIQFFFC